MYSKSRRPVFLNLLKIKLPPMAIASILHRIAGVLIILSLPFLIYLFDLSLQNETSFNDVIVITSNIIVRVYLYLLLWAISHHFVAGIRYFLVDLDLIAGRCAARVTSGIVIVAGILIPFAVYVSKLQ
ncbi:MAG TPA: succinate dehydrogenase, cytochrome b556 subunit [Gammaproteobacteria bacterium]|nr:succinate dehydrogenase, cytochrome b556 subunit [Gammaproteobacteria bacterium]